MSNLHCFIRIYPARVRYFKNFHRKRSLKLTVICELTSKKYFILSDTVILIQILLVQHYFFKRNYHQLYNFENAEFSLRTLRFFFFYY